MEPAGVVPTLVLPPPPRMVMRNTAGVPITMHIERSPTMYLVITPDAKSHEDRNRLLAVVMLVVHGSRPLQIRCHLDGLKIQCLSGRREANGCSTA